VDPLVSPAPGRPAGHYGRVPPDYEYAPVRLPPGTNRVTAATQLALQAEFGGWELSRVRLYADGTRKVILRRRRSPHRLPGPSV
jgi:hypothetical protein